MHNVCEIFQIKLKTKKQTPYSTKHTYSCNIWKSYVCHKTKEEKHLNNKLFTKTTIMFKVVKVKSKNNVKQ